MNWIISANGNIYNHEDAFNKWGFIDWKQKVTYELGDMVYIYCTAPIKKIKYKCKVIKKDLAFKEIVDDKEFWNNTSEYEKGIDGLYCRLELLDSVDTGELALEKLLENGLNGAPQGPMRISEKLSNYIEEIFNNNDKLKILYCRIGYMKNYNGIQDGDNKPIGGGAYNKNNIGHELYNFSNNNNIYYGYVQTKSEKLNLKRIDKSVDDLLDKIENVLVIWVATREGFGQCIVGWYKDATVYSKMQYIPENIIDSRVKTEGYTYNEFLIKSNNATLVLENRRNEKILGMGESNVWYGNNETNNQVLEYIENYENNIQNNVISLENLSSELEGKEKDAIVKIRENQGLFKKQLLNIYNSCCLCHLNNRNLLIASHIKPWKDSSPNEKLDPYNGLLLCPNHDKLFDLGYISFNDDGKILISHLLNSENRILLNINEYDSIKLYSGNLKYMKYHRENIFQK